MRFIIVTFLILASVTVQAQFGNPYGRGRQRNVPQGPTQTPSGPEKPDANLLSIQRADMYQEMLELDVFTKEVLKSYLKEYYATVINLSFDEETTIDFKRDAVEKEKKRFEKSLTDILNEEQIRKLLVEEDSGEEEKKQQKDKKKEKRKKRKNKKKG